MIKKILNIILRVLIGCLIWFVSVLLISSIGTTLKLAEQGTAISTIYSLFAVFIPIAIAVLAVMPRKKSRSTTQLPPIKTTPNPQPITNIPPAGNCSKSVYCTACGATLTVSDVYCTHCGAKVCVTPAANSEPSSINEDKSIPDAKTYRVTGLEHYLDNILSLALENDDYTKTKRELIDELMTEERIWKYNFYPVKVDLVPEPENPYDPNAIKVIVDSLHVGYIKKGSCKHLLKVIAEGRLGDIDCTIGGGPYKYIYEDYDDNGNEKYEMEREELNFSVVLHIVEHEA